MRKEKIQQKDEQRTAHLEGKHKWTEKNLQWLAVYKLKQKDILY